MPPAKPRVRMSGGFEIDDNTGNPVDKRRLEASCPNPRCRQPVGEFDEKCLHCNQPLDWNAVTCPFCRKKPGVCPLCEGIQKSMMGMGGFVCPECKGALKCPKCNGTTFLGGREPGSGGEEETAVTEEEIPEDA
jgi:hypothetical protein